MLRDFFYVKTRFPRKFRWGLEDILRESALRTLEQVEVSLRSRARRYQSERGPGRGRYPDEFKRELIALLRAGVPVSELATRMDIPKTTILRWHSKGSLLQASHPPCRPLRIVSEEKSDLKSVIPSSEILSATLSSNCIIRLSGGVEIAISCRDLDERFLRLVIGVAS